MRTASLASTLIASLCSLYLVHSFGVPCRKHLLDHSLAGIATTGAGTPLLTTTTTTAWRRRKLVGTIELASSSRGKYDDFSDEDDEEDDDEDEDDDDDDDDYEDVDDSAIADFRSRMSSMFGESTTTEGESLSSVDELINFARSQAKSSDPQQQEEEEWAHPTSDIKEGVILLANPAKFCNDFGGRLTTPNPALLSKFGLTLPPPADLGSDRRADLLPVLVLVETHEKRGSRAVLLNRRTGYLLGDLEQPQAPGDMGPPTPLLEKFCIQPLWFGGVDNVSSGGLDMLHLCPAVLGAKKLTDDGLYWGGDPSQAQEAMSDPSLERVMTGFDFKFFVQSTTFGAGELERQVKNGIFFVADVSKQVLMKSRDRMGTQRAKPLWTEIMELLDGEYKQIKEQLYDDQ